MRLIGTIAAVAGVATSTSTTAVPFTIPASATAVYYLADTADCHFRSAYSSVTAADVHDFLLIQGSYFGEATATDRVVSPGTIAVSVYSAGGGNVGIFIPLAS